MACPPDLALASASRWRAAAELERGGRTGEPATLAARREEPGSRQDANSARAILTHQQAELEPAIVEPPRDDDYWSGRQRYQKAQS